ncbi:hypothetical protein D3C79_129030 [compost metagenome]
MMMPGSYLFLAMGLHLAAPITDRSRVPGQRVNGIGFLGAGVRMTRRQSRPTTTHRTTCPVSLIQPKPLIPDRDATDVPQQGRDMMTRSTPVSVLTLPFTDLNMPEQDLTAQDLLEQGNVLYLPHKGFPLTHEEQGLLTTSLVSHRRKTISYQPELQKISGVADVGRIETVKHLTERYYRFTVRLLSALLPGYRNAFSQPQTSLRLHPVTTWRDTTSWRKDDTRLHVDAFPSRPVHGNRILRVFCNINPNNESRIWRTGEHFDTLATRFLPSLGPCYPLVSRLQTVLGITKSRRSHYDHLMLELHNRMKSDADYQQRGVQQITEFAAGSLWICFSDQTPHAAVSGQFMLEQTFMLPLNAMNNPQLSPLRILEKLTGQALL